MNILYKGSNPLILALALTSFSVHAGVIRSPASAIVRAGDVRLGSRNNDISNTLNQSGLSINFINGVTDFSTYLALNPQHTVYAADNEWFSAQGIHSASVTFDLGQTFSIARLALWNEELSGIGLLNLYSSTDNLTFFPLALGLIPTDNFFDFTPSSYFYSADVFSFPTTDTRYVRFDMANCPQPKAPFVDISCAIGEVAFDVVASPSAVPEPSTFALLSAGLISLVMRRRSRLSASRT